MSQDRKTATQTATGTAIVKRAPPSPRSGYALPVGNHPGNTGGKPGRSGGKTALWRQQCAQALHDAKALPVVKGIVSGDIHELVGQDREGRPIYGETKNADRLGAVKFLAAYAHGAPTETQEITGDITIRVAYDD